MTTALACGSSVGSSSGPWRSSWACEPTPITRVPRGCRYVATRRPIEPMPTMSTVQAPRSSMTRERSQAVAPAYSSRPVDAPSRAPRTHSATGPSRAPRALQSVACGGRQGSMRSVPADSTWTTASRVRSRNSPNRAAVPGVGTTKSTSERSSVSSNGTTSTSAGARSRTASMATWVTAARRSERCMVIPRRYPDHRVPQRLTWPEEPTEVVSGRTFRVTVSTPTKVPAKPKMYIGLRRFGPSGLRSVTSKNLPR